MRLWIVSMECAGIAEAGGVKNVTFSLCKEFTALNHKATLFIPVFKCTGWKAVTDVQRNVLQGEVFLCGKKESVSFSTGLSAEGGFPVVFVEHPAFAEKEDVYTYTESEQRQNPAHKKGCGHEDALFLDVLFQKAVAEYGRLMPRALIPDIVHSQDAATALLPAFLKEHKCFRSTKSVVTIHNAGPAYHHQFSSLGEAAWYTALEPGLLEKARNSNSVEPFLVAMHCGAHLTTVSEMYAKELLTAANRDVTDGLAPIFAANHARITGITNGFDFDRYNPADKSASLLPFEFNPEKGELDGKLKCRKFFIQNIVSTDNFDTTGIKKYGRLDCSAEFTREVFIAYHGRLTSQKGISVLADSIPAILENFPNVRFVITGQGESILEVTVVSLVQKYPGRIVFLNGYNRTVARLTTAVSDFIVLPSYFEPCGLEDFIAQAYGTLPVAHRTGGLNKIIDGKTGFLYEKNSPQLLVAKLSEVLTLKEIKPAQISRMIRQAAASVRKDYYWKTVVQKKYVPFFKEILRNQS